METTIMGFYGLGYAKDQLCSGFRAQIVRVRVLLLILNILHDLNTL